MYQMKHLLNHFIALVLVSAAVHAQESSVLDGYMEVGMEVSGVRAPFYDDEGNLQAQLYGGHVKIVEGGAAEVTNLRIDVFQKGEIVVTIFAPRCLTRMIETDGQRILAVDSEGEVLVNMEQMTIAGRGFRFTSEQNKFKILHDAKVLVKEGARNTRGLEL